LYPDTKIGVALPDLTIPQAAARLGVSVDTVKRRCKRGALRCRRTAEGRVLVELDGDPNVEDAAQPRGSAPQVQGDAFNNVKGILARLEAVTAERDWLRRRVESAEAERHELRVLLGAAQQSMAAALPAPQDAPHPAVRTTDSAEPGTHRPWWRFWRG
jgi:hypothetical protein